MDNYTLRWNLFTTYQRLVQTALILTVKSMVKQPFPGVSFPCVSVLAGDIEMFTVYKDGESFQEGTK